jgi:hypothetical protein
MWYFRPDLSGVDELNAWLGHHNNLPKLIEFLEFARVILPALFGIIAHPF